MVIWKHWDVCWDWVESDSGVTDAVGVGWRVGLQATSVVQTALKIQTFLFFK